MAYRTTDFRAYYQLGCLLLRQTADEHDNYQTLAPVLADRIRNALKESIRLSPAFAPGYHQLGFLELVQGEDLASAERYLRKALVLDSDDEPTLLALAQLYRVQRNWPAVRQTLAPLLSSETPAPWRRRAEAILKP